VKGIPRETLRLWPTPLLLESIGVTVAERPYVAGAVAIGVVVAAAVVLIYASINRDPILCRTTSHTPRHPDLDFYLKTAPKYVPPDPTGILHISLRGAWWLLEYFPRKKSRRWCLPRGKWVREIPENSFIHQSVVLSGKPVNLPAAYIVEPWTRYTASRAVEGASSAARK
jgi:hypothetical protein